MICQRRRLSKSDSVHSKDYKNRSFLQNTLKKHDEAEHQGVRHNCNQCSFETKSYSSLKTHKVTHLEAKFKCEICDKRFSLKSSRKNHINGKHESETFPCDKCDYVGASKRYIRRHIYNSHEGQTFSCPHCRENFKNPDTLSVHRKKGSCSSGNSRNK